MITIILFHYNMGYERDFLLRQLNAFVQALAEAIGLRDQGKILESLFLLDDLIRSDREAQQLVDLPLDEFIAQVDIMHDFEPRKWALIAEALHEKANLMSLSGGSMEAQEIRIKAMHLALEVLLSDPETFRASTHDLVAQLRKTLQVNELPLATLLLLDEFVGGEN